MAERAFNLACLVSFLACIGTLTMWQRSYRGCDVLVGQRGPADHATCTSEFGEIVFEMEGPQRGQIQPGWSYFQKSLPRRFRKTDDMLGFAVWKGRVQHYLLLPSSELRGVAIPYWFVFLMTGSLPTLWAGRLRRLMYAQRRREQGLCVDCGYDLRATATRCPECGRPVKLTG